MSTRTDRTPSSIVFETIGAIVSLIAIGLLSSAHGAIWVMLALGAAHDQWPAVPAFGYWTTFVLLMGLFTVGGVFRASRNAKPSGGAA